MDNLSIRRVPLDALHLDPANARSHPVENLEAIEASLRRFGQAEPLVVHKPSGRVIGGNGRLSAMKKLGWTHADVVELELDDLTTTALGITLNRTAALGDWDEPALPQLLAQLKAEEALRGIGFDENEVDRLLAELAGELPSELDRRAGAPIGPRPGRLARERVTKLAHAPARYAAAFAPAAVSPATSNP